MQKQLLALVLAVALAAPAGAQTCTSSSQSFVFGTLFFGRSAGYVSQGSIPGSNPGCAQTAFLAAGSTAGYVAGTDNLEAQSFALAFTGTTITGTLNGAGNDGGFENPGSNGRYATSGSWDYYDDGTFDISVSPNVRGFGFFSTDQADQLFSSLAVTYSNGAASVTKTLTSGVGGFLGFLHRYNDGNLLFLGLVLNSGYTLNNVAFDANGPFGVGGDTPGFDDFTVLADAQFATPTEVTPEPATMTLLATGLVGMLGAGARRRRNRRTA